ncbi:MAG TPA: class I SAM-dependent methyltransferase [Arachidicoccus sp.]|nr:class I SAM-dependent methyltransferase [Arachidicoccus sp.]
MEVNKYKLHWENVFLSKAEDEVSWFQPYPKTSIAFLDLFNLPLDANIIDIGGGDSHLVDVLIDRGYQNVYVLDISQNALLRAKQRLGGKANNVHWIVSDVTDFNLDIKFDFWHDRAAFHFLVDSNKVDRYLQVADRSIRSGGFLILGTFSENGPEKCSGLEVQRYSEASMTGRLKKHFQKIRCISEDHLTPEQKIQHFLFCSFRRKNYA